MRDKNGKPGKREIVERTGEKRQKGREGSRRGCKGEKSGKLERRE